MTEHRSEWINFEEEENKSQERIKASMDIKVTVKGDYMNRLEEIKERASKIGGTPWKASEYSGDYYYQGYSVQTWNGVDVAKCIDEKGEVDFIVNAPIDIAYLLQRLERYEKALKEITEIDLTWDEPLPTAMRRLAKEALKDEIT